MVARVLMSILIASCVVAAYDAAERGVTPWFLFFMAMAIVGCVILAVNEDGQTKKGE